MTSSEDIASCRISADSWHLGSEMGQLKISQETSAEPWADPLNAQLQSIQNDLKDVLRLLTERPSNGMLPVVSYAPTDRTANMRQTSTRSRRPSFMDPSLSEQWRSCPMQSPRLTASTTGGLEQVASGPSADMDVKGSRDTHPAETSASAACKSLSKRAMTLELLQTSERPSKLQQFVNDGRFEFVVGIFIFLNAILLGVQADHEIRKTDLETTDNWILEGVNLVFTSFFAAELVLRVAAHKSRFFYGPGASWNYLDLAIVSSSLLEVVFLILSTANFSEFRILRLVRLTKLMRVIRITRIVRSIRALRVMVNQLLSTLRSLLSALALLFLIIYVFAILLAQSFDEDRSLMSDLEITLLDHYLSSFPKTMLTLFESVTGGVNWSAVIHVLAFSGDFAPILFLIYICFTQFAVLNVLTGVFCQNAMESAYHDQELVTQHMLENKSHYVRKVKEIFKDLDLNGTGIIVASELRERLNNPRVKAYFETLDLDLSDLNSVLALMDVEPGTMVSVEEFVDGCLRLKGSASKLSIAKLDKKQDSMLTRVKVIEALLKDLTEPQQMMLESEGDEGKDEINASKRAEEQKGGQREAHKTQSERRQGEEREISRKDKENRVDREKGQDLIPTLEGCVNV